MYFGIFDGHAGVGAALMAANCLHEHIRVMNECIESRTSLPEILLLLGATVKGLRIYCAPG